MPQAGATPRLACTRSCHLPPPHCSKEPRGARLHPNGFAVRGEAAPSPDTPRKASSALPPLRPLNKQDCVSCRIPASAMHYSCGAFVGTWGAAVGISWRARARLEQAGMGGWSPRAHTLLDEFG